MALLINAINGFAQILLLLLAIRAICSWFVRGRSGTAHQIYQFLTMLTEPIVAPCRKLTSRFNTGMLDISVLLAFLLISIVRDVLIRVLLMIA